MIESSVKERDKDDVSYPCLMVSLLTGKVAIFTSEKVGTVVGGGFSHDIGQPCSRWDMENLVRFEGTITLENTP